MPTWKDLLAAAKTGRTLRSARRAVDKCCRSRPRPGWESIALRSGMEGLGPGPSRRPHAKARQ